MSIPYIPLYVTDYEADTSHLSLEEDGAYMRLLRLCWRTPGCSIPDDPEWIMRRLRVDAETYARSVAPVVEEYFSRAKGRLFQPRLQREHERINDTHKKRVEAGKRGGRPSKSLKKAENSESRAKAGPKPTESNYNHNQNDKENTTVCEFERFWTAYPRKQGTSKAKARDVYRKLDPDEQKKALACVEAFARSVAQTEERYVPHAATWLNQRRFETLDAGRPEIAPEVWRIWVKRFEDDGGWPRHEHGPPPGRAGCRCPTEILAEFGYTQSK